MKKHGSLAHEATDPNDVGRSSVCGYADLLHPRLMDFSSDSLDFDVSGSRQECVS